MQASAISALSLLGLLLSRTNARPHEHIAETDRLPSWRASLGVMLEGSADWNRQSEQKCSLGALGRAGNYDRANASARVFANLSERKLLDRRCLERRFTIRATGHPQVRRERVIDSAKQ